MRLVVKTYKYKLYNSKKNRYLVRQIELASEIWNFCIAMRRMYYLVYGKKLKANDLKKSPQVGTLAQSRQPGDSGCGGTG